MSAPAPSTPIARSSSHRGHHTPSADGSQRPPHRSQSTRVPSSSSHSSPRSYGQRPSSSTQQPVAHAAQHDYGETTLAQPPSSAGQSASREKPQYPQRSDSMRAPPPATRTSSRGGHDRYGSQDGTQQPPTNGVVADLRHQPTAGRRRTTLDTQTGRWGLGKTIGAGSMGKVKLARNLETGEQVAIKIVPRQSTDEHRSQADRERAEHSKEIRTAREAAIVSLVNHPYICGMRDVVRTAHHWYMLFEYVNGGQMLDYIISHGKLKEKQARKFARQICSALDYCHRNSIVHRDLKIENILISKNGDIKIIDFGLSNLFSPHSHLKTFCGSLYFAAPELLQAKQYTGPEVDVWSFGIVLYVLVCGKVPFDDQSMPQLHAKIKKGHVEYPPWLSVECKNIISRMLVTDPRSRASLAEIASHPWMNKGFNGPPENFLPHREPLQVPLDQEVILRMTGFDFGSPEYIATQLTKMLTSEDYQRAVRNIGRKNSAQTPEAERKRGVFDFYKRRNSASRDTLTASSNEAVHFGEDPVNAYNPLISVYYLVREKMERERHEANPGALSIQPTEKPVEMAVLQAPPAAYTNSNTYEMKGEAPTGGRTRPRARTHGEDEVTEGIQKMKMAEQPGPPTIIAPAETPVRKESTAAGLLRRFSTRRKARDSSDHSQNAPIVNVSSPTEASPPVPRKSFSVRRTRTGEGGKDGPPSSASLHVTGSQKHQPELLTPPSAGDNSSFPKRFMSLRRSTSVDRRRLGKRGASEGTNTVDPPPTSGSDNSSYNNKKALPSDAPAVATEDSATRPNVASRAKSLGHARRESIQARRLKRAQQNDRLNVPEETEAEVAEARRDVDTEPEATIQPVVLKGLFSVSTTSSKSLSFIQNDIIRVLIQRGLEYEEIKGGFMCTHYPSIDTPKHNIPAGGSENLSPSANSQGFSAEQDRSHKRKISFNALMGNPVSDKDKDADVSTPRNGHPTDDDYSSDDHRNRNRLRRKGDSPNPASQSHSHSAYDRGYGPSYGGPSYGKARNPGETSTQVRDDVGEDSILRFEIFIVKIPIIGLYGVQFKKVDGNMMHYKNMAQEILQSLRL